jgi:uncharacterized protein (TIGR03437 family)
MRFISIVLCWIAGVPAYAAYRIQQITQIPALPGQAVSRTAIDSHGNIVVAATTPTSAFVLSVDPNGNQRFTRTVEGEGSLALALDARDDIYVSRGANVAKLSGQDGKILYATTLPSFAVTLATAIAVDSAGQAVVAVYTFSNGVSSTTPGAYDSGILRGGVDTATFVVRLSVSGSQIFRARYGGATWVLTGGSSQLGAGTYASQVLVDSRNNIWLSGDTNTIDLPVTSNALKPKCGCSRYAGDGFLAELSGDGSTLLYATYIGTSSDNQYPSDGNDQVTSMAFDSTGRIWLAGSTNGVDLPVTDDAFQKQWSGTQGDFPGPGSGDPTDGFLLAYDPATNRASYVTYFGGTGADTITNILPAQDGTLFFAGVLSSLLFDVSGFTRGRNFVAGLNARGVVITRLLEGATGTGLGFTPAGSIGVSGAGNALTILQPQIDTTRISLVGITSAAAGPAVGQVAPGELVSLYGSNIGPAAPAVADLTSGRAPTELAGVQVLVDNTPIPLLYVQNDQVNAIIPFDAKGAIRILVRRLDGESNPELLGVVPAAPEAIKNGPGMHAAAINQDQTVNGPANPARLGAIVSVYATGFGQLTPQPQDGILLSGIVPTLNESPVQVSWTGYECATSCVMKTENLEVTYAGPAPNLVAGVTQINFKLADFLTVTSGQVTVSFKVGGWPSSQFVVFVQE